MWLFFEVEMSDGNVVFVLHTHLPYVLHHGEWPHGSDWLCEAVSECYIPLLNVFHDLLAEGVQPSISIDISPILCEQLEHPDFKEIFIRYCDNKINLAHQDAVDMLIAGVEPHMIYLAHFWQDWYSKRKRDFIDVYDTSIVQALKSLQDQGAIELLTCGITHGYLPLLGDDKSVYLQMKGAVENYKKHFGGNPRGTWIPECAYRPSYEWRSFIPYSKYSSASHRKGVEEILNEVGLEHFIVDQHLFSGATKNGHHIFEHEPENVHALQPLRVQSDQGTSGNGAIAFARHRSIALQVWSGETGYPGDSAYLDFHKKHAASSLRYWRVTDNKADMQYKQMYNPDWIAEKTDIHAYHFIKSIESILQQYQNHYGKQGVLCLPFDTELFGHWWFEGPEFLKNVLRGLHHSPFAMLTTSSQCLDSINIEKSVVLPEGSWGKNGNHEVWMNPETEWTWELIYKAEEQFGNIMLAYIAKRNDVQERILKQMLRELLLMQSSDWQFLITTVSAKDYAEKRFVQHNADFHVLIDMLDRYKTRNTLPAKDFELLHEIEKRNAVFSELSLDWWK